MFFNTGGRTNTDDALNMMSTKVFGNSGPKMNTPPPQLEKIHPP